MGQNILSSRASRRAIQTASLTSVSCVGSGLNGIRPRVIGGQEEALKVCQRTRLFTLGESLGGVESLIEHPGLMTHASVAGSSLQVPNDLIRLSVGIEDVADLLQDLRDALD